MDIPTTIRLTSGRPALARAERFFGRFRRVGLRGVLADTNRLADRCAVPGEAVAEGFRWQRSDDRTRRWFPQGITTSADAYGHEPTVGTFRGEHVALVSWYARGPLGWLLLGSRISVVAGIGDAAPRYRHVLLVVPRRVLWFHVLRPVRVHAGGIVWYGDHLYVAGGDAGLRVFRLDDVVRVRNRLRTRGYRYVLPQTSSYRAVKDERPLRYSFLSLDRGVDADRLVVGEYGRKGGQHRLVRFGLDRETQLLLGDEAGFFVPTELHDEQPDRMQGATLVGDVWVVVASAGPTVEGDLWVGAPGAFRRRRGVLPPGPEDVAWWPQRGQVWSLSEWPRRRWVFGVDVDPWVRPTR